MNPPPFLNAGLPRPPPASPLPTTCAGLGRRCRRLSADAPPRQNCGGVTIVPSNVGHPRPEFPAPRGRHHRHPFRQILLWRERTPVQVGRVAVSGVPNEHRLVAESSQCFLVLAQEPVQRDARDRAFEVVKWRWRSILSMLRRLREVLKVSTIQPTESLSRDVAACASCGSNCFVATRKFTCKQALSLRRRVLLAVSCPSPRARAPRPRFVGTIAPPTIPLPLALAVPMEPPLPPPFPDSC